jgi:hypothetical protein
MNMWKDLDDAVQEAIKVAPIGRPVFVRCLMGVPEDRENQVKSLVDAVMTIRSWVDDAIDRLMAVGTWGSGLSILVVFRRGASSLISTRDTRDSGATLIILGNHGAIYRDDSPGVSTKLTRSYPESETKRAVRAALELTVASGTPQVVREERP